MSYTALTARQTAEAYDPEIAARTFPNTVKGKFFAMRKDARVSWTLRRIGASVKKAARRGEFSTFHDTFHDICRDTSYELDHDVAERIVKTLEAEGYDVAVSIESHYEGPSTAFAVSW